MRVYVIQWPMNGEPRFASLMFESKRYATRLFERMRKRYCEEFSLIEISTRPEASLEKLVPWLGKVIESRQDLRSVHLPGEIDHYTSLCELGARR